MLVICVGFQGSTHHVLTGRLCFCPAVLRCAVSRAWIGSLLRRTSALCCPTQSLTWSAREYQQMPVLVLHVCLGFGAGIWVHILCVVHGSTSPALACLPSCSSLLSYPEKVRAICSTAMAVSRTLSHRFCGVADACTCALLLVAALLCWACMRVCCPAVS